MISMLIGCWSSELMAGLPGCTVTSAILIADLELTRFEVDLKVLSSTVAQEVKTNMLRTEHTDFQPMTPRVLQTTSHKPKSQDCGMNALTENKNKCG